MANKGVDLASPGFRWNEADGSVSGEETAAETAAKATDWRRRSRR